MMGYSREVLASLGVDVWIPRVELCQEIAQVSTWRDQVATEIISESIISIPSDTELKEDPLFTFVDETSAFKNKSNAQHIECNETNVSLEDRPALVVSPFNFQVLALAKCIILVEGSQLSSNQQQLWVNMQKGLNAEFSELNWPFALVELQDGFGVENYIQGFIDSVGLGKELLLLGEVPHVSNFKTKKFSSLQEMLEQPLLKKELWHFIKTL